MASYLIPLLRFRTTLPASSLSLTQLVGRRWLPVFDRLIPRITNPRTHTPEQVVVS